MVLLAGGVLASIPMLKLTIDKAIMGKSQIMEDHFREVIVAKGIKMLAELLDKTGYEITPKTLLCTYSSFHWPFIKQLLENPEELDKQFQFFKSFIGKGLDEGFFQIREYGWIDDSWQLKQKKLIS